MKQVYLVVKAFAVLLLVTSTAWAMRPIAGTDLIDFDGCDPEVFPIYDCGNDFYLCEEAIIDINWKLFFDKDGNENRYWETQKLVGSIYELGNPNNFVPYTPLSLTYKFDFLTGDEIVTGVWALITVPGYGQIFKDVGRTVFDFDGNITFEAGEHECFNAEWDAVCAHLGAD